MESDSQSNNETIKTGEDKKWPWSISSTVIFTILLYIVPQIIMALIIPEDLIEVFFDNTDNVLNFVILVFGELLTVVLLILVLKRRKKSLKDLGLLLPKIKDVFKVVPALGVYILAAIAAFAAVSPFLSQETLNEEQDIGFNAETATTPEMLLVFIALVVVVPIIEELLFRGFVFKGFLRRLSFWPAAIFSSLLFGLAHLQINVAVDTFVMGIVAAWLAYNTKNLWPAIALHALKNLIAFLVLFEIITIDQ